MKNYPVFEAGPATQSVQTAILGEIQSFEVLNQASFDQLATILTTSLDAIYEMVESKLDVLIRNSRDQIELLNATGALLSRNTVSAPIHAFRTVPVAP